MTPKAPPKAPMSSPEQEHPVVVAQRVAERAPDRLEVRDLAGSAGGGRRPRGGARSRPAHCSTAGGQQRGRVAAVARAGARARSSRLRDGVPDDRRARGGAPRGRLPARPRALDGAVPRARAREAAPARGRGRRRQDRGGEVARDLPRRPADPAAVLRGARRRARGLRVELPTAAAPHPRRPGGRRCRRTSSSAPSS